MIELNRIYNEDCLMGFTDAAFDRARTALIDKHYRGRDKDINNYTSKQETA